MTVVMDVPGFLTAKIRLAAMVNGNPITAFNCILQE